MARPGDTIENPLTGERVTFLRTTAETGGELLELELTWPRSGRRTPPHMHPEMEERWTVLEGAAAFLIGDGPERRAEVGETVVAPPGTVHVAWNPGPGPARVRAEFRPALGWEPFIEQLFAFAGRGDGAAMAALAAAHPREITFPVVSGGRGGVRSTP